MKTPPKFKIVFRRKPGGALVVITLDGAKNYEYNIRGKILRGYLKSLIVKGFVEIKLN